MEKVLFSSMEEGKIYETPMLVMAIAEKQTKNGEPYCIFTLSDGSAQQQARRFKNRTTGIPASYAENEKYLKKVCRMKVECSAYGGATSYLLQSVDTMEEDEYDLSDFVRKAPLDSEFMYNAILNGLKSQCTSSIKDLAISLYEANKETLLRQSAASSVHHAFYGGLLYHTLRMLNHAVLVCKIYPSLNKDILLVGTALHDIGKIPELVTDEVGIAEYSVDGNLFGHLLMGVEMVTAEYLKDPGKYNAEEVRMVKHLIASHHDKAEHGAIKSPATAEAHALYLIDAMDAKMEICEEVYPDMKPGEMEQMASKGMDARLYCMNLTEDLPHEED